MLLLFGLLEISLRLYHVHDPAFMIVPDTTYMKYRGKPFSNEFNGFKLNSRGYKDVEFNTVKKSGTFRILAIGDSQTYGAVPYPESYITLVENKLREACAECEILNMGVPSTGPVDYLSILLNEGFDLQPDMILLHFNVFDDFKNGGKRFKLYSYSAAAAFINSIISNSFKPEGVVFGSGMYREGISLRSDSAYMRLLIDAHGKVFLKNNPAFIDDFQSSFSYLREIKKICGMKNVILAVVMIPADLQIHPALQKKALVTLRAAGSDADFRIPNRMLAGELNGLRIPYIDLLDYFLINNNMKETCFTQGNDPHWNRFGSRVAADSISPWLIRQVVRYRQSAH